MANQSDRSGNNFNSGSAMQQHGNNTKADKNKNNPKSNKGDSKGTASGKSGKQGGCC